MPLNLEKVSQLKTLLNRPLPGGRGFQAQRDLNIERLCREAIEPDPVEPAVRDPMFTDADRDTVFIEKCEEIRDCVKDLAIGQMEEMTKSEIAGYLVNTELLVTYHKLTNTPDGMTTEELLADIAQEPPSDHIDLVRLGMLIIDDTVIGGYRITDFGIEVCQEWN